MTAPAPTRASGTTTIQMGLVSIPCKLYTGSQDSAIKRSEHIPQADGTFHRAGRGVIDKETGQLHTGPVTKMIDTSNGLVELADDEINSIVQAENGTALIECFMPTSHLGAGHFVTEGLIQVRPEKAGEKAFHLILTAMRKEGVFALLRYTRRDRVRLAALLPTGRMYPLMYSDEIREDLALVVTPLSDQEMSFARQLIQSQITTQPPELADEAAQAIRAYAEEKATNGEAPVIATPVAPTMNANDLLAALQASVEANKVDRSDVG